MEIEPSLKKPLIKTINELYKLEDWPHLNEVYLYLKHLVHYQCHY